MGRLSFVIDSWGAAPSVQNSGRSRLVLDETSFASHPRAFILSRGSEFRAGNGVHGRGSPCWCEEGVYIKSSFLDHKMRFMTTFGHGIMLESLMLMPIQVVV